MGVAGVFLFVLRLKARCLCALNILCSFLNARFVQIVQSADRRVIHFTVKVRPPGSAITVNLCKLELSVVEAPDGIIRDIMKQLINSVNSAHREQEKQRSSFADLRQQCLAAQVRWLLAVLMSFRITCRNRDMIYPCF